jgi:hypothetical protein
MAQYQNPRDIKTPEPRPARDETVDRKDPPKPVIKEIYSDWAMI